MSHPSATASILEVEHPILTPTQVNVFDELCRSIEAVPVTTLRGDSGAGKSLLMQRLANRFSGKLLRSQDILAAMFGGDSARMEESLVSLLNSELDQCDHLFIDDHDILCSFAPHAGRPFFIDHLFEAFVDRANRAGKKIVFSVKAAQGIHSRKSTIVELAPHALEDYLLLFKALAGDGISPSEVDKIYRVYRKLTPEQIAFACICARRSGQEASLAESVIRVLALLTTSGNVDLEQVEPVSLEGLVGVEDIVAELRRTVVIPMTQPRLAKELGLKPKRGVLLHGSPGTGKTTIGRALAHSMKGKFLMIDGTFNPAADFFYARINSVMKTAELNSPSVIFIDDADVIFQNEEMKGFVRQLLTKLDGLQSESQTNICVVMTAMNINDMPPALLRSGRAEVWLEMRLPDADQRWSIIELYARGLDDELSSADRERIAQATDGFTPADLRGLVEDARGHMAYDRHRQRQGQGLETYILLAASEISRRKALLNGDVRRAA